MKTLIDINSTEKARLLHELFPQEIPDLIQFIKATCADTQQHADRYRAEWNDDVVPFESWLKWAQLTGESIARLGHDMQRSSRVFSDQLGYGPAADFVNDCIMRYAGGHANDEKFKLAVQLLYH